MSSWSENVLQPCTSQKLLLVVEAVLLHGGDLHLVLLDDLLQGSVQLQLLLLQELLLLMPAPERQGGEGGCFRALSERMHNGQVEFRTAGERGERERERKREIICIKNSIKLEIEIIT